MIHSTLDRGVAVVTLDHPPLNLVTLPLTARLAATLDRLAADPTARVLIVTGAGPRAFSAGSDLGELPDLMDRDEVIRTKLAPENDAYTKLAEFPKPTLAALDGLAYGGGLELAVCCDLLVAAADVKLALPEIKLGWFPGSGGPIRVTRRIGPGRAKALMFTGEPIDAATALAWGLVDEVAPSGRALSRARELAELLASRPGRALALCKQAIALAERGEERQAVLATLPLSATAFRTADAREGIRAFFAKEPPRFSHA